MKCPYCGEPLIIAGRETTTTMFGTNVESLTMVCINSRRDRNGKLLCPNYCGPDTNHPLKVAATIPQEATG
jgi:hypothetical protein